MYEKLIGWCLERLQQHGSHPSVSYYFAGNFDVSDFCLPDEKDYKENALL